MPVPGILAGMGFDGKALLSFLATTIHDLDRLIESAVRRFIVGKPPQERFDCLMLWREVALLANEFCEGNGEFRDGKGAFNSPFDGILGSHVFHEAALIEQFCIFLYLHRDQLLKLLESERRAERVRLELAEALVISEVLMDAAGHLTELESEDRTPNQPTRLQVKMWETRVTSIEQRYAPATLAA